MKKTYDIDVNQVKENIIAEVNRYISNTHGYPRELFDYNIKQILEEGFKEIPTDFKG